MKISDKTLGTIMLAVMLWSCGSYAEDTLPTKPEPTVTEAERQEVLAVFSTWVAHYSKQDFNDQWRLTDPRIRHWFDKRRWRMLYRKAVKRTGALKSVSIRKIAKVPSDKIPCTEAGHCYRRNVETYILLLDTAYEKTNPVQPEYAVIAKSREGWKFGGGTFPDRPFGETMVILTESDFRRYQTDKDDIQRYQ